MELSAYSFTDIFLSAVLALIMLGVGMSLTADNFRILYRSPKPLLIGLTSQIIVLPLIAFGVAYFSGLPAALKVGLIILAACPGGTTAGLLAYFFKGNVALSITFTAINSIITLFTIPLVVNLSLRFYLGKTTEIHLSFLETFIQILVITVIPTIIGMMINKFRPRFASRLKKPLKLILAIALGIIFVIYFYEGNNRNNTGISADELWKILPPALLLNFLCMTWGFMLGKITGLGSANSYTLGIEASVHNTALAFLVAGTLLQEPEMVKPALIYGLFSFWTAVIYSIVIKKLHKVKLLADFN
jgi:bile acid:Na+ symporter, BASS family